MQAYKDTQVAKLRSLLCEACLLQYPENPQKQVQVRKILNRRAVDSTKELAGDHALSSKFSLAWFTRLLMHEKIICSHASFRQQVSLW